MGVIRGDTRSLDYSSYGGFPNTCKTGFIGFYRFPNTFKGGL